MSAERCPTCGSEYPPMAKGAVRCTDPWHTTPPDVSPDERWEQVEQGLAPFADPFYVVPAREALASLRAENEGLREALEVIADNKEGEMLFGGLIRTALHPSHQEAPSPQAFRGVGMTPPSDRSGTP